MNVLQILDHYNVEYIESGRNVAKGNVNVQCPWCGEADRSQHMGIQLSSGLWGCWRDARHRGRVFAVLLSKLTSLSLLDARRATDEGGRRGIQQGQMESAVAALQGAVDNTDHSTIADISLDQSFRAMWCTTRRNMWRAENRYRRYLICERGFDEISLGELCKIYHLHYCVTGDFAGRIIIPVYENKKLMTYLGRSIYKNAELRYRALEKEKSVKQVKDCVYNYDQALRGGKTLVIVEGATDVWKVDLYNRGRGLTAVGLFNMNVEEAQLELLHDLSGRFEKYVILLDRGEIAQGLRLQGELWFLKGIESRFLDHVKDPGDLSPRQAKALRDWL